MPIEIEHKYLVNKDLLEISNAERSVRISQGYMSIDPEKTIRIRTSGELAFLTIKGKTIGASRPEFEYQIPKEDALELLSNYCSNLIEKTRYYINFEGKLWEVDVFEGKNDGLIMAEIELHSENESYLKPVWLAEEVTNDFRYANANLSVNPFNAWK